MSTHFQRSDDAGQSSSVATGWVSLGGWPWFSPSFTRSAPRCMATWRNVKTQGKHRLMDNDGVCKRREIDSSWLGSFHRAGSNPAVATILSMAQCSRGINQSRPYPARSLKIMESAGQCRDAARHSHVVRTTPCQDGLGKHIRTRAGTPAHAATFL